MTPVLTPLGLLSLSVGVAFVLAGAILMAWPLVALGVLHLSALLVLYFSFLPTGFFLKRRQLAFAWWIQADDRGALMAGCPLTLTVLLRNQTPYRLLIQRLRVIASSTLELPPSQPESALPRYFEARFPLAITPRAAGHWFFHGLSLQLTERWGFFALHLYYPNLLGITVLPRFFTGQGSIPFKPQRGGTHQRTGLRILKQPGMGSEFREIRDHTPGDPFKRIAWKATARRRKLMVREDDSEILATHWLLLDCSSSMRQGGPGVCKLDFGLSLCAGFARLALSMGDRVGLITFDQRIYNQVAPSDNNTQHLRIIERLTELHNIVDQDLTALTENELFAAVADFLLYQEGINVRFKSKPPPENDPLWRYLAQGPKGELYHLDLMLRVVRDALVKQRSPRLKSSVEPKIQASTSTSHDLRRYCQIKGIELPYRSPGVLEGKQQGMAAALKVAAASRRSQFIFLISDFEELTKLTTVLDGLLLARRHHHSLSVIAPFGPYFEQPQLHAHQRREQSLLALKAKRQRQRITSEIAKLGIPVYSVGRQDALPLVLRRLSRFRPLQTATAQIVR